MKKTIVCFISFIMLIGMLTVSIGATSDGPLGAKYYNGHYYRYYDIQMSWSDAKAYCEQRGGHLVTIGNVSENEFVASLFSCESIWLGGNDIDEEGTFIWYNGEPFDFANWNSGEPNNGGSSKNQDYIHMYRSGKWDDIQDGKLGFVCEWDSWEPTSTISIPSDAVLYNDHYYKLYLLEYDWEKASYYCEGIGGHLATISNFEENTFVNQLAQSNAIWIGGSDMSNEGVFEWLTGETFYYQNWSSGEPNNGSGNQDCIQMYANGLWDDEKYSVGKYFICEWDYCCISSTGYSQTHNWTDWEVTKDADCFSVGEKSRQCNQCNAKETVQIEQLMHQYGNFEVVSGSKLIPPIVKEKNCSLCGNTEQVKDWSYVWIPILVGVVAIFAVFGVINYIKAIKKR